MKHLTLLAVSVLLASVALLGVSLLGAEPSQAGISGLYTAVKKCGGGKIQISKDEAYLLNRHNVARSNARLAPLCVNPRLQQAAKSHNDKMIADRFFSHYEKPKTSGDVSDAICNRLRRFDASLQACGENIGYRSSNDLAEMFSYWMGSRFHQPNINGANARNYGYREVGISVVKDTRTGSFGSVIYQEGRDSGGPGTLKGPGYFYTVEFGK